MGTTTIQVENMTVHILKQLRDQYQEPSYDSLIRLLIRKATKPTRSLYGAGGKLSRKEILNNLRDKHDRY